MQENMYMTDEELDRMVEDILRAIYEDEEDEARGG